MTISMSRFIFQKPNGYITEQKSYKLFKIKIELFKNQRFKCELNC